MADPTPVPKVQAAELAAELAAGAAIWVADARPGVLYAAQHIRGARSLPFSQLERRLGEVPAEIRLVFY